MFILKVAEIILSYNIPMIKGLGFQLILKRL